MKFQRVPLSQAGGHILGHNVSSAGRRVLRKGRRLSEVELAELRDAGIDSVYVAALDASDVGEDAAAQRIGSALAERAGLKLELATGGRVTFSAPVRGVLAIRGELLLELNLIAGVTLATPANHLLLAQGEAAGTLKIIPFALSAAALAAALSLAERGVLLFRALEPRRVSILVGGSEGRRTRLLDTYRPALEQRLAELGSRDVYVEYVPFDREPEAELAAALERQGNAGADLVIVVGETATMDSDDLIPQAIRRASGQVRVVGAPVFPGNLLLLGYRFQMAILGAPGCARSRAPNVIDLLLPRLLTGERPGPREIAELGLGGLLERRQAAPGDGDG
jgi:molybdenum cofactor cytidylyltransferase